MASTYPAASPSSAKRTGGARAHAPRQRPAPRGSESGGPPRAARRGPGKRSSSDATDGRIFELPVGPEERHAHPRRPARRDVGLDAAGQVDLDPVGSRAARGSAGAGRSGAARGRRSSPSACRRREASPSAATTRRRSPPGVGLHRDRDRRGPKPGCAPSAARRPRLGAPCQRRAASAVRRTPRPPGAGSAPPARAVLLHVAHAVDGRALRGGMRSHARAAPSTPRPAGISPSPHALSSGAPARSSTTDREPGRRARSPPPGRRGRRRRRRRSARYRLTSRSSSAARASARPAPASSREPAPGPRARRRQLAARGTAGAPRRGGACRSRCAGGCRCEQRTVYGQMPVRCHDGAPDPVRRRRAPASRARSSTTRSSSPSRRRARTQRHRAAGPHAREPVEALLELLRRVVGAAEDDQVLGAAADEELAARTKPRSPVSSQPSGEHARGRLGLAEVAGHDERPADEDAADPALGHARGRPSSRTSTSSPGTGRPHRHDRARPRDGLARAASARDRRQASVRRPGRREGHRERRLGEAVHRQSAPRRRSPSGAKRSEKRRARASETGSAPLRRAASARGRSPSISSSFTRLARSRVGEVGRGRDRGAVARDRAQPERRPGEEVLGRDEDAAGRGRRRRRAGSR